MFLINKTSTALKLMNKSQVERVQSSGHRNADRELVLKQEMEKRKEIKALNVKRIYQPPRFYHAEAFHFKRIFCLFY